MTKKSQKSRPVHTPSGYYTRKYGKSKRENYFNANADGNVNADANADINASYKFILFVIDFVKPMDISKDLFDDSDEVPSSAEKEETSPDVAPSSSQIRKDNSAQCVQSSPFSLSL